VVIVLCIEANQVPLITQSLLCDISAVGAVAPL
jgi:hypothetical protein